ncbi:hypothetical protein HFP89_05580 [Wenzhouxiangella sp. XN79A]|uniref:hypothetical protein n=1 Tax=Wenzhouxiangella sp. XN79A TaxID=2724193 RepID=UPI00144A83E5|nr:hypothetical protein [Wenzhouxiangella sp. XN79A]NKI34633.1 hypothetical protein [Wenzhouxiangella sp. XN79A]
MIKDVCNSLKYGVARLFGYSVIEIFLFTLIFVLVHSIRFGEGFNFAFSVAISNVIWRVISFQLPAQYVLLFLAFSAKKESIVIFAVSVLLSLGLSAFLFADHYVSSMSLYASFFGFPSAGSGIGWILLVASALSYVVMKRIFRKPDG